MDTLQGWGGGGGGGVGGRAACEGAILLQIEQSERVAWMSAVMPGQKTEASAFDVMDDVPWWAACRAERQEGRRALGMTILSL